MPDPGGGWFDKWSRKILDLFSRREVKTPLAFFFRCVWALIVIIGLGIYLIEPSNRMEVVLIGIAFLAFLVLVVGIFAWWKPKHLVYGETGHRAEFRLTLGTEKGEIDPVDAARIPGTTNPGALAVSNASEKP